MIKGHRGWLGGRLSRDRDPDDRNPALQRKPHNGGSSALLPAVKAIPEREQQITVVNDIFPDIAIPGIALRLAHGSAEVQWARPQGRRSQAIKLGLRWRIGAIASWLTVVPPVIIELEWQRYDELARARGQPGVRT
jgi:hypothetical protein